MWCVLLIVYIYFNFFICLFIYGLCWVFVSVRGLSLVAASGGHSSSQCVDLSLSWPLLLWSTGSRRAGSVIVAHGPSCSTACGIFPDQGSNLCPLHWQANSQPLRHQGSPFSLYIIKCYIMLLWFISCDVNIDHLVKWFHYWRLLWGFFPQFCTLFCEIHDLNEVEIQ